MFRIALVLFKHVLGRSEQLAECPSMYETMEKLRKIPAVYMEEDFLVQEVCCCLLVFRAADRLEILIAINCTIKVFNRD